MCSFKATLLWNMQTMLLVSHKRSCLKSNICVMRTLTTIVLADSLLKIGRFYLIRPNQMHNRNLYLEFPIPVWSTRSKPLAVMSSSKLCYSSTLIFQSFCSRQSLVKISIYMVHTFPFALTLQFDGS